MNPNASLVVRASHLGFCAVRVGRGVWRVTQYGEPDRDHLVVGIAKLRRLLDDLASVGDRERKTMVERFQQEGFFDA